MIKRVFENKKVMIIVPHEDDELNLAIGIIDKLDKKNLFIVYVTNGEYACEASVRIKESKKMAKKLRISYENIIYLGYADQHFSNDTHIYMTDEDKYFISNKNLWQTNLPGERNEFHYEMLNEHALFNRSSLINDIILLLRKYKPDVIMVNDFDSHPDHRAVTLSFDHAMKSVITDKYKPQILKGFTYPTAYLSYEDFDAMNIKSTKFKKEKHSSYELQNPYYTWEERIRFPVHVKRCFLSNKLYKFFKIYKSQLIIRNVKSIINSDQVFFRHEVNNLCLNASIEASSGNVKYLNDFIKFDCEDIMHSDKKEPKFKEVAWIPSESDKIKKIHIKFETENNLEVIRFFQNSMTNGKVKKIKIEYSDNTSIEYHLNNKMVNEILLKDKTNILWINIYIIEVTSKDAGFSEIEVVPKAKRTYEYVKILINDDVIYKKFYTNFENLNFKFYSFDGIKSIYLNENELNFYINDKLVNFKDFAGIKNSANLKVSLKENEKISDEIKIVKYNFIVNIHFLILNMINKIIYSLDVFTIRVINRINKILRSE